MLTQQQEPSKAYVLAGIFTLSLRLIVGWTYFSAFWRRLVLENKLIPDGTGYLGVRAKQEVRTAYILISIM